MNIPASAVLRPWAAAEGGRPQLLGAAPYAMGPGLSARPHSVGTWLLEYYLTGRLDVDANGRGWMRFDAGAAALYPPNTPFRERLPAGCAECTSYSLFFDDGGYAPLRRQFGRSRRAWLIDDPDGAMRRLIDDFQRAMDPGPAADLWVDGCFTQLIAMLLRGHRHDDGVIVQAAAGGEPDLVAQAHQFMRQHMGQSIRMADVADAVGLSESGFAHAYRRATGAAPMTVLRTMRVEAAKAFLLRGRTTLQDIAEQTGFADAFHLSRTFKRMTGLSPNAYRRSVGR